MDVGNICAKVYQRNGKLKKRQESDCASDEALF